MRGIYTNAQRQFRTGSHDHAQVFEAMADALALSGGVLEQNSQAAELQTFAGNLKTERANLEGVLLATTTRTAGMHYQVIGAQSNRPLDFFTERFDRFEQEDLIGRRKINKIVCVNQN